MKSKETLDLQTQLLQFLAIDVENHNAIVVDYDTMAIFLLNKVKRHFSPSQLEKAANIEFAKLVGKPLNDTTFKVMAKWIDEYTLYLQYQESLPLQEQERYKDSERHHLDPRSRGRAR